MFCPACGREIGDDSQFCPKCGTRVVAADHDDRGTAADTLSGGETLVQSELQPVELPRGQLFHGRYEIKEVLGRGGMGVVYLAGDKVTGEEVCLKVIQPALVKFESAAQRFLREGKLTRNLRHPNIVAVYDVNVSDGIYYLSMEYLKGMTLRRWISENLKEKRQVPLEVARGIAEEILEGLGAAHKEGVVHRDLKPGNVILLGDPWEGDFRLKILDFGIARALGGEEKLTREGAAMGTPVYMAPEQETAPDAVGPEADLYAMGVIFYEILLGLPPRPGWEKPSRVRPELPVGLDGMVEKALFNHPARRFHSAQEFRDALARIAKGGRSAASGEGSAPVLPTFNSETLTNWWNRSWSSWPKAMWQWYAANAVPAFAWAPWLSLYLRTKVKKYLRNAVIHAFPFVFSMAVLGNEEIVDEETVMGMVAVVCCFWLGAVIHAFQAGEEVKRIVEGENPEGS